MSRTRTALLSLVAIPTLLVGCDDEGPTGPDTMQIGDVSVSVSQLTFAEQDINFGATATESISIMNGGSGALSVFGFTTTGPFSITAGGTATSIPAGGTASLTVAFDPSQEGAAQGALQFMTDDPDMGSVQVALSGTGVVYRYTQVDREGIPTINTVFNHPPAFSKTSFNIAGPIGDLAAYREQFEIVLGAVANPDPEATAALLLPDELPVSLGAAVTSFATLTGRAPADDAVDVALTVVVGVPSLQSDNVDTNDVAFLAEFPYLAPAN